jgi:uncharacterized membrane protein YfcA
VELWQLSILGLVGIIAGFVNVLAGGGSLLTMPVMKLLLGLDGPVVNGTNRIAIGAGAISSVAGFFRRGFSDFRLSITLSLCALPGAIAGALLGCKLRGVWFDRVLAVVMIAVLVLMSFKKPSAAPAHSSGSTSSPKRTLLAHILMLAAGFYGGFIQAGVGFILMTILHRVMGLDLVRVNMHKVFIVAVYTMVAIIVYAAKGHVLWIPGICLALGNSTGAWIGTHFAIKKGQRFIRLVFNIAVVGLVVKLLVG